MKEVIMYKCEGCGEIYSTAEEAKECEALGIPEIRTTDKGIEFRFPIPSAISKEEVGWMMAEMAAHECWSISDAESGILLVVSERDADDPEATRMRRGVHDYFGTYLLAAARKS